jgi:hypothetical protein
MNSNGQHELKIIEKLLKQNRETLRNAAETIRLQDVSNYPIFVISQKDIELGIPLILRGHLPDDWMINASTLEEFYSKQIIATDKVDDFRALYKKKSNEICVFAFMGESSKFLFIPA